MNFFDLKKQAEKDGMDVMTNTKKVDIEAFYADLKVKKLTENTVVEAKEVGAEEVVAEVVEPEAVKPEAVKPVDKTICPFCKRPLYIGFCITHGRVA